MATETLLATSLEASSNLTGALTAIDEDPDTPDASWMTATDSAGISTSARVGFATPSGTLTGSQTFKAWVRKVGGVNTPQARLDLYENGVLVASGTAADVTSTSGVLISASFDASLLADSSGAGVQVEFVGIGAASGKASNRSTVELGAINWDTVTYSASSPQTVAVTGRTSASSYGAVTATAGNVNVTVAGRTSASSFGTVTPTPGAVTVTVAGRTSASSFGAVTAQGDGEIVPVTGRTSASSFGATTAVPGAVLVAATGRTSASTYGAVTTAAGNTNVTVAGRTSASSYGTPTIAVGGVTVTVSGRTSVSSFGTVTDGDVDSAPPTIVWRLLLGVG